MSRPRAIRAAARAKRSILPTGEDYSCVHEFDAPEWWRDAEPTNDDMDALADQYQREQIASANSGTDEINYRRER